MNEMDVGLLLKKNPSFEAGWKSLRSISDISLSDKATRKVFAIKDLESDVRRISRWFSKCLSTHVPPENLKTLRVRLFDPGEYDLVLEGYSARYSATNSRWFTKHCYDPYVRAKSRVLKTLMTLAYEQSDLEQYEDERFIGSSICLAYACLATRQALEDYSKCRHVESRRVDVCVGWDDDDRPILVSHI